jgi:hypothetical protein
MRLLEDNELLRSTTAENSGQVQSLLRASPDFGETGMRLWVLCGRGAVLYVPNAVAAFRCLDRLFDVLTEDTDPLLLPKLCIIDRGEYGWVQYRPVTDRSRSDAGARAAFYSTLGVVLGMVMLLAEAAISPAAIRIVDNSVYLLEPEALFAPRLKTKLPGVYSLSQCFRSLLRVVQRQLPGGIPMCEDDLRTMLRGIARAREVLVSHRSTILENLPCDEHTPISPIRLRSVATYRSVQTDAEWELSESEALRRIAGALARLDAFPDSTVLDVESQVLCQGSIPEFTASMFSSSIRHRHGTTHEVITQSAFHRLDEYLRSEPNELLQWNHLYPYCYRLAQPLSARKYWEVRYSTGGSSGHGSYGRVAQRKAAVVNEFVRLNDVASVVELGCGDGNQLALYDLPHYTGLDISTSAIQLCRARFCGDSLKCFARYESGTEVAGVSAQLALSIDVIFHIVEDTVFDQYMRDLFSISSKYVVVYSTDLDDVRWQEGYHIRHRRFTEWVLTYQPQWHIAGKTERLDPESPCHFVFFTKRDVAARLPAGEMCPIP